jgi:UDP-N-acetylmuramoyl-L-alanyl-D-glutamate--2,6-diaminopimelate ligase
MMKTLSELAAAIGAVAHGSAEISSIEYNSQLVQPGSLFVAVRGEKFDGHAFLHDAVLRGAGAVVVEKTEAVPSGMAYLLVSDARAALALVAGAFYDQPTQKLYLAGITGTNGKTTTTKMIDAIARAAGDLTGTIGTLGTTVGDREIPNERTTPESADLQRLFAEMVAAGASSAAMEVASHALALNRTLGCAFDVGVFTNLTQDHLDFHQTMENYEAAKGMLFREYAASSPKNFVAVLNLDDAAGRRYASANNAKKTLTYSASGDSAADIFPINVTLAVDQIQFDAKTPLGDIAITLGFGGKFQIANALAALRRRAGPIKRSDRCRACALSAGDGALSSGESRTRICRFSGLRAHARRDRECLEGRAATHFGQADHGVRLRRESR